MLEDLEHENRKGQKSRPSAVEFDGGGGSNVDQVLEDHPVTSAAFEGPLSEQHLLRVVAIPDRIIEVANDDILLGDECFEPLGSGLWPIAAMEP
jgi:ureidoglycolate hydrolase